MYDPAPTGVCCYMQKRDHGRRTDWPWRVTFRSGPDGCTGICPDTMPFCIKTWASEPTDRGGDPDWALERGPTREQRTAGRFQCGHPKSRPLHDTKAPGNKPSSQSPSATPALFLRHRIKMPQQTLVVEVILVARPYYGQRLRGYKKSRLA